MENKENKGSKVMNLFQKLYRYRLKIDKDGQTILNWSSLFSLACLIFAPYMSIAGLILSMLLGYHLSLETNQEDSGLEERVRQTADSVKKTATMAAKIIRDEVKKTQTSKEPENKAEPAETEKAAVQAEEASAQEIPVNQDLVEELEKQEKQEKEFQANPAMYRSVYSAVAGSVPTLEVHEKASAAEEPGSRQTAQQ